MSATRFGADHAIQFPVERTGEGIKDEVPPARDRSSIPNFVFAIMATLILAILAFVAQNFYWKGQIDKDISRMSEMRDDIKALNYMLQNIRTDMGKYGYVVDDQGHISKPKRGD